MINKNELLEIKGGASKLKYIGIAIAASITFIIGVIDGYLRPMSCNK